MSVSARRLEVLVIYEKLPEPLACGSDLRLEQILEALAADGHRVSFVGRNPAGGPAERARLERLCTRVLGPDPERIHWEARPEPPIDLEGLLDNTRFDACILDTFFWTGLSVAEQYLPLVRRRAPKTPILLVTDDCHWLREERRAAQIGRASCRERVYVLV